MKAKEPPALTRAQQKALNSERWGPPDKHNRYTRIENKDAFAEGMDRIFGKRTPADFQTGKRHKQEFDLKTREELDRQNNQ
jgi:hypothetical protein